MPKAVPQPGRPWTRRARLATALLMGAASLLGAGMPSLAQDANVTLPVADLERMLQEEPFRIVTAEISRPKAKCDITLKAEISFDDRPPLRV